MDKLVASLVNAVLGYVAMWLNAKKAERLEVKVKQIESDVRARDIERALAKKLDESLNGKPSTSSPASWNRGKVAKFVPVVFFVLAFLAEGCLYYEGRWPIIPEPARPVVPEDPPEWTPRETILSTYAGELEDLVEGYNAEAKKHNVENGFKD